MFSLVLLSVLVELSFADVHVEGCAGYELWKHCGHQASRADTPDRPTRWVTNQRGLMLDSACTVTLVQATFWACILTENSASFGIRLLYFIMF